MKTKSNLKKSIIWNTLGTGLNSFTSLFFLVAVTRINGLNEAGIFTIAYSTACILYIVGIYAGRIFQVTENKKISNKDFIAARVITCSVMLVLVMGFGIIRQYEINKFIIFVLLTFYKMLEAFSDCLYAILQKNDLLHKVGISYFVKALVSTVVFIIIDCITHNIIVAIIAIIIIWICIMIIYDIRNTKLYINKDKVVNKNVIYILKNGFLIFAITFLALYIINASKYSIDIYSTDDIQTIYGIIIMPATVMALISQFIIHPFINEFNELCKKCEFKKIIKKAEIMGGIILLVGILACLAAYILGIPVLELIYNVQLDDYRFSLVAIIFAATVYNIAIVYQSVLITLRKSLIQLIIHVIISIIALIISNYYTIKNGIYGAVTAYCISMGIYFVLYFSIEKIILLKEDKNEKN